MANLKATLIFDAAQFANDAKKAVASLNTQFSKVQFDGKKITDEVNKIAKGIKIKPVVELPAGSIASLKKDLADLVKKRSFALDIDRPKFNAEIEQAKKKIRELEKEGTEAGKRAGSFFAGNFRGNIQALGIAGAAAGLFSFAKGGLQGFQEDAKRSALLTTALENTGHALDGTREKLKAQEDQLKKTTLFTDDQIRAVQAQGVAAGLSGAALDKFTKGTLDFATAQGKDAVISAQRFGKAITEGKDAVDENGESLGKAETQFAKFAGAAEKAASGPAGAAKQAQKTFEDFQETVGGLLAKVLGSLAPILTSLVDAIGPVIDIIGTALGDALKVVAPLLTKVGDVIGKALVSAFEKIAPILPPVVDALVSILDAILPILPTFIELSTLGIDPLVFVLKILSEVIKFLADNVLKPLVTVVSDVQAAFTKVVTYIANQFTGAFKSLAKLLGISFDETAAVAKVGGEQTAAAFNAGLTGGLAKAPAKVKAKAPAKQEKTGATFGPSLADLQAGQFKLDEARKKSAEEIARFLEDLRLTEDEKELRDAKELFDQKIALAVELGQSTVELEQRKKKAIDAIEAKQLKEEKDRANDRLNIKKAAALAELDIYKRIADQTAGLAAEGTAVAKIAGIASVGISTYVAAAAALTLPPTGAGPILGIPLAAGIIIDGLLTASKIAGIPAFHEGTDYFMPPGGAREGYALLERGERVVAAKNNTSGGDNMWLAKELSRLNDRLDSGINTNGSLRVETIARTRTEGTALVSAIKKVQYQRSLGVLG